MRSQCPGKAAHGNKKEWNCKEALQRIQSGTRSERKRMIMEFEKLQEIIADVMNVTKDDVQPETKFVEDLSADSLDILQIITELEEAFDFEIDNEDADKIVTVQDAVDQIKKVVE